ncbi:MAG: hypothetical protein GY842_13565 [bacterium]|nr:hypothetical protein [bacterium]
MMEFSTGMDVSTRLLPEQGAAQGKTTTAGGSWRIARWRYLQPMVHRE